MNCRLRLFERILSGFILCFNSSWLFTFVDLFIIFTIPNLKNHHNEKNTSQDRIFNLRVFLLPDFKY